MSKFKEKLYNPWIVVAWSVSISLLAYLVVSLIVTIPNFWIGFLLSAMIPIAVSLPISIMMIGYFNKIKQQKDELQKLDTINKKLFSLISHDIRSPIATLKGFVEMIISQDLDAEEGKEHLEKLSKRIDNLLLFLNDLLEWSRRQAENKNPEPTLFKSNDVFSPVFDLLKEARKTKNIELITKGLESELFADKDIYAFIVRNIFHNAIKFTPEGGKIWVSVKENSEGIHTIIKDSGIGFCQDSIDKIYDGEEWFTNSGTSDEQGTGFGLKTSLHYLNICGGTLLIDSEPGNGATITVVFPKK